MRNAASHRPFVSSLLAASVAAAATITAHAQNGDRSGETQGELPADWQVKESPIHTAAQELATFSILDGYEIQLVASEPLVEAPVAFKFAPDGRLWVLEMRGYMQDPSGASEREPLGRVKLLSDTNGDGVMDKADVFLDGLVMPRAIAPWRDGLLVVEPPNLLFCRDTNHDGKSDESRVIATGFAGQDSPEHAGNGLLWSLDNTFVCSQHPYRFVPSGADALRVEAVAAHGQWGISEDAFGRLYYSPNSDPLLVDLVPKSYAARNPSLKGFEGVPMRAANDMRVYPSHLTPGVNRAYQKGVLKDGKLATFTGACSPMVYDGDAMGADMKHSALVCEVAGNLVHRYRLSDADGKVVATPADGERSFLTSTDERFRPVFCAQGTDGAIYVADMYRGIIQHRLFMTTFLRKQVDARGLAQPVDAGRIWRIVPKGGAAAAKIASAPDFTKMDSAALVEHLASAEKPQRETARRLLVERNDGGARVALTEWFERREFEKSPAPIAIEKLWALAGVGGANANIVNTSFGASAPMVRVHALRVAERMLAADQLAALLARAVNDADESVRVQAALSAGALDATLRMPVLEASLRRDLASRAMRSAVMSSIVGAEGELLDAIVAGALLDSDTVASRAFAAELADMLLDNGSGRPSPDMLRHMLGTSASVAQSRPWLAKAMLERVAAKQHLNAKEPLQLIASYKPEGWFPMLDRNNADLAVAVAIDRNVFWPGREDVSFVPPKIAKAEAMSFEDFGKRLFSNCMSCHQATGRGLPPVYPPLRGSAIVQGDPATAVKILLYGLEGKIEVDGQTYNQVMPAAPVKSDEEIAAVLSYVRSAWGNSASAIEPAFVAKVREETKGRNRSFTAKELGIEAKN